jgi:predicted site-specific integrase-resolvase
MATFFSTREVAELLTVDTWRVRRLFEDGDLPEPSRFAGKRAIPREAIPQILDALRARGWLKQPEEAAV